MHIAGKPMYVIMDYHFWCDNADELESWLEENTKSGKDTQAGMTLSFADTQEELLFILRWGA
jgi:dsDNA-binding SOS-regulon protein